jgi:hypothetical protein
MAITQLHGILFANQNMQVAASKQIDLQGRVDFQNIAAAAAANEKSREIEETRPTEEGKNINPDREHNKERADEEAGAKEEETKIKFEKIDKDEDIPTTHLLDIKA